MMHRFRVLMLWVGLSTVAGPALAQLPPIKRRTDQVLRMYPDDCKPAEASPGAAAAWQAYGGQVLHCRLRATAGHEVLVVETVRPLPPRPARPPAPLPRILDLQGRLIGTLPGPWPGDDPAMTHLKFGTWRDGFPERVELLELRIAPGSGAATAKSHPFLHWNRARGVYEARGAGYERGSAQHEGRR